MFYGQPAVFSLLLRSACCVPSCCSRGRNISFEATLFTPEGQPSNKVLCSYIVSNPFLKPFSMPLTHSLCLKSKRIASNFRAVPHPDPENISIMSTNKTQRLHVVSTCHNTEPLPMERTKYRPRIKRSTMGRSLYNQIDCCGSPNATATNHTTHTRTHVYTRAGGFQRRRGLPCRTPKLRPPAASIQGPAHGGRRSHRRGPRVGPKLLRRVGGRGRAGGRRGGQRRKGSRWAAASGGPAKQRTRVRDFSVSPRGIPGRKLLCQRGQHEG